MLKRRIVSLVLALGFLLSTVGPALATPADGTSPDQLPPGLAKKVFIHYDKDYAQKTLGLLATAAATSEQPCGNPASADCPTFVYTGTHWSPNTTVTYFVNANYRARKGASLTQASAKAAIDASFQQWQAVMPAGGVRFVNGGSTKVTPGKADGRNVIGWGALSSGTIAVTTVWYYPSSGQIVETDMTFNTNLSWAYTPPTGYDLSKVTDNPAPAGPAGTYDLQDIATHEAGHTLMLGDLYDSSNSALTMYGYGSPMERSKDSLGTGDKLGADYIY